jgi:hypothetical protein
MKKWSSHRVESPSSIVHTGSFPLGGHRTSAAFSRNPINSISS